MVKDDDGHAFDLVATSGRVDWVEEAEPEVSRRVNDCIGGGNTIRPGVGTGRLRDFEIEEVDEASVDGHVGAERGLDDPGHCFEKELRLPCEVGFGTDSVSFCDTLRSG